MTPRAASGKRTFSSSSTRCRAGAKKILHFELMASRLHIQYSPERQLMLFDVSRAGKTRTRTRKRKRRRPKSSKQLLPMFLGRRLLLILTNQQTPYKLQSRCSISRRTVRARCAHTVMSRPPWARSVQNTGDCLAHMLNSRHRRSVFGLQRTEIAELALPALLTAVDKGEADTRHAAIGGSACEIFEKVATVHRSWAGS